MNRDNVTTEGLGKLSFFVFARMSRESGVENELSVQSLRAEAPSVALELLRDLLGSHGGRLHRIHHAGPQGAPLELVDTGNRRACGGRDGVAELRRVHLLLA